MKHVNLSLPDEAHKLLKFYCVEHNTNMVEVIRKLVLDFLEKQKKKAK
jgi:hypothetical protein